MTGWRIGFAVGNHTVLSHLWRLKTNMDSGMFGSPSNARGRLF